MHLEGHEEEYIQSADPGRNGTHYAPVYSYNIGGLIHTHRSKNLVGLLQAQWLHKNTKPLHVRADGKIFEMATVVSYLIMGIGILAVDLGLL